MYRYLFAILTVFLMTASRLSAQTPVEEVIIKYEDVAGARKFIAQGMGMVLARKFIRSTQVAPIASEVDELYVLKMQGASPEIRTTFVRDLDEALKSYEYYGKQPSKNGTVEVYVHYKDSETVSELVIYNPTIYSLNSLCGQFSVQSLLSLYKEE